MRIFYSASFLLFFISIAVSAQDKLHITGKIFDEKGPLKDARVEIIWDSTLVDTYYSNKDGNFSFDLSFEREYIISFQSEGYSEKKVSINTSLPEAKNPMQHQLVSMKLELIKQTGYQQDVGVLGEIKFSRVTKEFAYESKYDKNSFLNIEVTGIDYYLSSDEQKLLADGELELLDMNIDIQEKEFETRKETFYDYIIKEREKFLGAKADSIEFDEIEQISGKAETEVFDTIINEYARHRMQVTEIIITNRQIIRVYHRVKHYWGATFYFKNYRSISGTLFYLETHINKQREV
jgi:hypothetical protein